MPRREMKLDGANQSVNGMYFGRQRSDRQCVSANMLGLVGREQHGCERVGVGRVGFVSGEKLDLK